MNKMMDESSYGSKMSSMTSSGSSVTTLKPVKAKTLTHQQIADRAKAIWQKKGCPVGQDEKNWSEAEAQLKRELGIV